MVDGAGNAYVGNKHCVRLREGGELLDVVECDRGCFACALGGADGSTLFIVAQSGATWKACGRAGEPAGAAAPAPGTARRSPLTGCLETARPRSAGWRGALVRRTPQMTSGVLGASDSLPVENLTGLSAPDHSAKPLHDPWTRVIERRAAAGTELEWLVDRAGVKPGAAAGAVEVGQGVHEEYSTRKHT